MRRVPSGCLRSGRVAEPQLLLAEQRRRFRHDPREKIVRRLSAAALGQRFRGNGHWTGNSTAHRQPARRARVGRNHGRSRRNILLYALDDLHRLQGGVMMQENTILLVEDNPKDEALTLRALQRQTVQADVVVARDGVEALEYLLGQPGQAPVHALPKLVLLDLKLP